MSYEEPPEYQYGDNVRYWEERCRRLEDENAKLRWQLLESDKVVPIPIKTAIRCLYVISHHHGPDDLDAQVLKSQLRHLSADAVLADLDTNLAAALEPNDGPEEWVCNCCGHNNRINFQTCTQCNEPRNQTSGRMR
jgi:hypothetical protein